MGLVEYEVSTSSRRLRFTMVACGSGPNFERVAQDARVPAGGPLGLSWRVCRVIGDTTPKSMDRPTSGHYSDANICPPWSLERARKVLKAEPNAETRSTRTRIRLSFREGIHQRRTENSPWVLSMPSWDRPSGGLFTPTRCLHSTGSGLSEGQSARHGLLKPMASSHARQLPTHHSLIRTLVFLFVQNAYGRHILRSSLWTRA